MKAIEERRLQLFHPGGPTLGAEPISNHQLTTSTKQDGELGRIVLPSAQGHMTDAAMRDPEGPAQQAARAHRDPPLPQRDAGTGREEASERQDGQGHEEHRPRARSPETKPRAHHGPRRQYERGDHAQEITRVVRREPGFPGARERSWIRLRARVHPLRVTTLLDRWAEEDRRLRAWVPIAEVARFVQRKALLELVVAFRHRFVAATASGRRARVA